jgi:peptidylprolyl isomerase
MRNSWRALAAILIASAACSQADSTRGGTEDEVQFAASLGIDLSRMTRAASGLYTRDLEPGAGEAAQAGQNVRVHYTGWLTDGTKFDSSLDRGESFGFTLGAGNVIPGWDEGVAGMRPGGKRQLVIPPQLGYGAQGYPGAIPPNATLVFEVQLLEIVR